ncbi:glutathione-dependent disulfide-bond oxidoreductase [Novosphingobium rosa]|uniref:glutathione-dependent disulfide-bond oxidoreductase n=1 Tax=Novosphingobium rosa TaxID=76978 RepID=UPI00082B1868|nr:glutathione-dependent disulfide-bond oxidoreductase [Novosphingobium rosa]
MTETYTPPKVWTWDNKPGVSAAALNRPVAGATHEKDLPVGQHAFQLYSLGTPNGQKASIMFEELIEAGYAADYDAWFIGIGDGDQFGSGFVDINPNSKIPALLDRSGPEPVRVFESGSILVHLAEKFGAFLPTSGKARTETFNWLMWQMGSAPFIGGGFGHFYFYAPEKIEYAINRYAMETKRLLDVADRRLAESRFLAGDDYTIADMATFGWFRGLIQGDAYGEAADFLSTQDYEHVGRWVAEIDARPGTRRGRFVNKPSGGLRERHAGTDFAALDPALLAGTAPA